LKSLSPKISFTGLSNPYWFDINAIQFLRGSLSPFFLATTILLSVKTDATVVKFYNILQVFFLNLEIPKTITMRIFKFLLVFMGIILSLNLPAQVNIFLKDKPVPGERISIRYNPQTSKLFGVDDIQATAFLLEGKLPLAREIILKKDGNVYTGEFLTNDSTQAVIVRFAKDELIDDNNEKGFATLLYNKQGQPVKGAQLALSNGFNRYSWLTGVKREEESVVLLEKEFQQYPGSKILYRTEYWNYLRSSKNEANQKLLLADLQKTTQDTGTSEEDLTKAKQFYARFLKDTIQQKKLDALIKKRFPNGSWKITSRFDEFYETSDLGRKEEIYKELRPLIALASKDEKISFDYLAARIARAYSEKEDHETALRYAAEIKDKFALASLYNSIARKLAGEGLDGSPSNIELGKELSSKSLAIAKESMSDMSSKPSYYTESDYKKNIESRYHYFAETYAIFLYHGNELAPALDLMEKTTSFNQGKNISNNEAYAVMLEKLKGPGEAGKHLEQYITDGKYNSKMVDQLKRIYLEGHSDAEWTAYFSALEKAGTEKMKLALVKKMINMPAPSFALKDLNGNTLSLNSLKGKVVVVDFWAMWCGPCIASFPGMQKAVDKYKNDPNVAFVFIDTWEAVDKEKVTSFLEKNKYSFNVLFDETRKDGTDEYIVVGDYKVEGIPTKFVVDRNSNIRFKSVGYNGSPDELLNELSLMIELADEGGGSSGDFPKKAF
jgi:thiol-disulfide isomerase/thioredoxin